MHPNTWIFVLSVWIFVVQCLNWYLVCGTCMLVFICSICWTYDYCSNLWIVFQNLTGIKGLSEAKVDKIYEAAEKLLVWSFMLLLVTKPMQPVPYNVVSWNSLLVCLSQNQGFMTGNYLLLKVWKLHLR
jgi:cellulose synthase/poly-beta-1,6-N-acetylglucosamine synthase-like glycosyltransferase